MSSLGEVVVVGGGLAGLSAALTAADGGCSVTLFEARPRLGGATWSFERHGLSFDNGQHVFMRCCSAYRRFLERIGSTSFVHLQDRLLLPVLAPVPGTYPRTSVIARGPLPGRLAFIWSLLTYRHLSLGARLRSLRGLDALSRLHLGAEALDRESLGGFLRRHGQNDESIGGIFELITLPTVNLHANDASLALAAKVFRTGLLDDPKGADLGWSKVPLSKLHAEQARARLEEAGAKVRTGAKVTGVELFPGERRAVGVRVDGEAMSFDAVVLALPHEETAELVPPGSNIDPGLLGRLSASPIIDVHLVYDRKVMDHNLAAGVSSPVQFVFDRTGASGLDPKEGQCLAVSVSAAESEHGERPEVLIERYERAVAELFPKAKGAHLIDAVVSREHRATFKGVPGTNKLRAPSNIGFSNFFLAGAWTDTGWPATMEGAVRSGVRAGENALAAIKGRSRNDIEEAVA